MTIPFPTTTQAAEILEKVRQARPRVHCLMNTVVQKFTADGITVVGGIPSMTTSLEEIESFVAKADALTINLGTLDAERRKVILLAVEIANASGKPWIVDPVHCDYSPSRLAFARELITLSPAIVRGNRAEMSLIGEVPDAIRIDTGPVDHLSDATRRVRIVNGHPWMAKVTGTGCLSGGVIAAFMAVEQDALAAAASALAVTGVSAELAASCARGPGTFEPAFLDALSAITGEDIINHARIENEQG
ncbi:hydroxyethylthiazole kinase [Agrobacterium pusense]|uniref:hydroxyethylthiazole kinase n=1 Tax=Agrobacterium pusense TaxID=648995 RepID=UPI000513EF38|nr:hydroxyethylthiazole kinase [Agrobacterium pusense]ANV25946.1 hydroxyethylthiazole kinase [Rhizobium sp. S41]KGE82654.1 hydroxyethylthiazole kinase [Rhizobium sp. H41]QWW76807.1 hydroxyethylthiazole kinase [Agrobacterium pusense]